MSGCDPQDRARSPRLAVPGQKVWTPPVWQYRAQSQTWQNPTFSPAPPGYTWSFSWDSATFDLRPDLASSIGQVKAGTAIADTAARMYVLLTGDQGQTFDASGMEVFAVHYVQVTEANSQPGAGASPGSTAAPNLVPLGAINVSSDFYPGGTAGTGIAAAVISPPGTTAGGGEGYPIRYWRLRLNFQYFVETVLPPLPAVLPPTVVLTAGVY